LICVGFFVVFFYASFIRYKDIVCYDIAQAERRVSHCLRWWL